MATDKYDLHTIDYSVQGWDSILSTDMEKLDSVIHSRLLTTLGETVAAKKAVYIPRGNTKYFKAQANQSRQPALGITVEAGVLDSQVRIQATGLITDMSWAWVTGKPVFLSPDTPGELTQVPPASGKQVMGMPVTATTIVLSGTIDLGALPTTTTTSSSSSSSSTSSTMSSTSSTMSSTSSTMSSTSSTTS